MVHELCGIAGDIDELATIARAERYREGSARHAESLRQEPQQRVIGLAGLRRRRYRDLERDSACVVPGEAQNALRRRSRRKPYSKTQAACGWPIGNRDVQRFTSCRQRE